MNIDELKGHMNLAHVELSTIDNLKKSGKSHFDETRLKDAQRHYNKIREKYHTKKAQIENNILRIA